MQKIVVLFVLSIFLSFHTLASIDGISKVDTFNTTSQTLPACEDAPGLGTATFDLTSVEDLIITPQPNVTIAWFEDTELTITITDPTSHIAGTTSVFAQITSTVDSTCSASVEVLLMVTLTPDLTYLSSIGDTICGRRPVTLGNPAGPAGIYSWTPATHLDDSTSSNPLFTPIIGMDDYSFDVSVQSPDGHCSVMQTVTFKVLDADLDIIGPDSVEVCQKSRTLVSLSATTSEFPENIVWSSDRDTLSALTGESTSLIAEQTTRVFATQVFVNGCVLVDTFYIRVDSLPEFKIEELTTASCIDSNRYCPGELIVFQSNSVDLACFPDISYLWTGSSGFKSRSDTTLNAGILAPNGPGFQYTRVVTNHACVETDFIEVTVVDTMPPILGMPMEVCLGDQFQIEIDPLYLPTFTDFMWMNSDNITLSCDDCPNPTVTVTSDFNAERSIFATVMGIKENCCTATGSVSAVIIVPPVPIEPLSVCIGGSGQIIGDPNFTNYMWTPTNGAAISPNNVSNPTVNNVSPGGATFTVTAVDPSGCPSQSEFTVTAFSVNGPVIEPLSVCIGGSGQIISDPNFTNYMWTPTNGATISPNNVSNPTVNNVSPGGATFTVTAVDPSGCPTQSEFAIGAFEVNDPNITPLQVCPEGGGQIIGDASFTDYIWSPQTPGVVVSPNDVFNPILSNMADTTVRIIVEATDADGCPTISDFDVTLLPNCVPFIPNAFAPSGTVEVDRAFQPLDDEENRSPIPANLIEDFKVFNRWGQKVYDNDSNATGWDGRQDGELAPSDVYLYIIELTIEDGTLRTFTGDVTLVR